MNFIFVTVFVGIVLNICVIQADEYEDHIYEDDYPMNLQDMFIAGSGFCHERSQCLNGDSTSYPDKSCYCDEICTINNDCCQGYAPRITQTLSPSLMSCVTDKEYTRQTDFGYQMVDRCNPGFAIAELSSKCENEMDEQSVTLKTPVTSNNTHLVYKNMYCAFCNKDYDILHWNMEIKCEHLVTTELPQNVSQCDVQFWPPKGNQNARLCPNRLVIDSCPDNFGIDMLEKDIKRNCSKGAVKYVYATTSMYKNKYCAMCHSFKEDEIYCEQQEFITRNTTILPERRYSFRLLIDFNSNQAQRNGSAPIQHPITCRDDEIFDLYSNQCRTVFCFPPRMAYKGKCILHTSNSSVAILWNTTHSNCTFVKYTDQEYRFINQFEVFIKPLDTVYNLSEIYLEGSDVFICIDNNHTCVKNCNVQQVMFDFDRTEQLLSTITLIISVVSLALTFTVYVSFPVLLNTPGKILLCLIISLFFAQLSFLVAELAESHHGSCVFIAMTIHFFYLSSFCWLNIIALDLWVTFSKQFISAGSDSKSSRRMYYYCAYAWGSPLLIIITASIVDNINVGDGFNGLKPLYGDRSCWIGSSNALLLFFVGPAALSELFNIVSFIFTSCHIARANKQGAMARGQASACTLLIIIKLAFVMGLTWVFAFVASMFADPIMWYIFICLNGLQGFYICICFIFTRKVIRLLKEKFVEITTTRSSASTQLTSLEKSSERNRSS